MEAFKKGKLVNNIFPIIPINEESNLVKPTILEIQEEIVSKDAYRPSWYNSTCQIQCTKNE